jgi:F0F1-type ATP synthase assembly protein I
VNVGLGFVTGMLIGVAAAMYMAIASADGPWKKIRVGASLLGIQLGSITVTRSDDAKAEQATEADKNEE